MYLFGKYGYIVIPSTNKKGTELYECVMLDPDSEKPIRIYPQIKKGECAPIDVCDYTGLIKDKNKRVFLFQTDGRIENKDSINEQITIVSPKEVFMFACDRRNRQLLPDNILKWLEWLQL